MKKNKKGNKFLRAILVAVICAVATFGIYKAGVFNFLENKAYDSRMKQTAGFTKADERITLIVVDQESLDWAKQFKNWSWPWPREAYAEIIDFMTLGNAKSVMFDMFYTEPSIYGPEDDQALVEAQKRSGVVCQTVFLQNAADRVALFPIEPIKESAAIIANVTSVMDDDDVIRRYCPFFEIGEINFPSLGMAPMVLEKGKERSIFDFPSMADDGTVKLRYRSSLDNYIPVKASDIIVSYENIVNGKEGLWLPEDFEDSYVFFALYAPGLFDICSTPTSQVYPGVGVHITALDNYLNDDFVRDVPEIFVILWIVFVCFLGAFMVTFSEERKSQAKIIVSMVLSLIIGIIITFVVPIVLFIFNMNLLQVVPFVGFLLSFFVMFGIVYTMEGKQKRFIKSAFSQCLSKDVVNDIINDPSSFTLGGKKMEMSAIFTDIQKFSSFSELLTASQLGTLLNYYLTKMSDIIINERGTVDKYEGDAIVAMVGAPVQMNDHAARACRAAIKMKKEEKLMNKEIQTVVEENNSGVTFDVVDSELFDAFKIMVANKKVLFTRVGINSGEMIAGYFGSTLKKNYTIMGNNVNLAARLEGVNKQYSTYGILISEFTRKEIGDEFVVRRLDNVQVVNVNTPIQLFELLEEKSLANQDLLTYVAAWEEAMNKFVEKKYPAALEQFYELKKTGIGQTDNVVKYYISLIENFFIKGKYPTEADDIGVAYNPELEVFKLLQK